MRLHWLIGAWKQPKLPKTCCLLSSLCCISADRRRPRRNNNSKNVLHADFREAEVERSQSLQRGAFLQTGEDQEGTITQRMCCMQTSEKPRLRGVSLFREDALPHAVVAWASPIRQDVLTRERERERERKRERERGLYPPKKPKERELVLWIPERGREK